jgi:predicted AlkP superfamily phosphohydrolase/phosphomutase
MSKVLVIGLDGGTYDLILPLVERGYMPHMSALLQQGSWGRLASTIPPFTAAAWSTFATGRNPGQHGILSFQKRDRFHYHAKPTGYVDARQLDNTLWEILSWAGKQVAVVNVPVSYPPRPVNGLMITGMMTPPQAPFTYPDELMAELPGYRIDVEFIREGDSFKQYGLPPKGDMLADIRQVSRIRTHTCLRLMQEKAWDFFMVVYTGTDRLSHFFWDDLAHLLLGEPAVQPDSEIQRGVLAYFQELDEGIGQLLTAAGPDTNVLFMSDHGFGASPTQRFYANVWLEQLGLLQPRRANRTALDYWRLRVGRTPWLKGLLRRLLSAHSQEKLSKAAQRGSSDGGVDWTNTRAYFVPIYFHVCGIEINTEGLHREGVVRSGEEYEALRERIIAAATAVRHPQTGAPIVQQACRRETLFSGPHVTDFPDIILVLDPDYIGMQSLAGAQLVERHEPFRPGEHRPDGIFLAHGPAIMPRANLPGLRLADVSATILYLLDVPIPTSFDGRVLAEIVSPDFWQAQPPQSQALTEKGAAPTPEALYSTADEAELEERLRSLGYLE